MKRRHEANLVVCLCQHVLQYLCSCPSELAAGGNQVLQGVLAKFAKCHRAKMIVSGNRMHNMLQLLQFPETGCLHNFASIKVCRFAAHFSTAGHHCKTSLQSTTGAQGHKMKGCEQMSFAWSQHPCSDQMTSQSYSSAWA